MKLNVRRTFTNYDWSIVVITSSSQWPLKLSRKSIRPDWDNRPGWCETSWKLGLLLSNQSGKPLLSVLKTQTTAFNKTYHEFIFHLAGTRSSYWQISVSTNIYFPLWIFFYFRELLYRKRAIIFAWRVKTIRSASWQWRINSYTLAGDRMLSDKMVFL